MRYICRICGYVYDEAAEKTPFGSLPESWKCPLCGAAKQDFEPDKAAVKNSTSRQRLNCSGSSRTTFPPSLLR